MDGMKIYVCFQIVYEFLSSDDFNLKDMMRTEPEGLFSRAIDAYDECALEMALRMRDGGHPVELTAVTVSPHDDKRIYESLYALGFDRVIRVNYAAPPFHPLEKAAILAPVLKDAGLVLTGKQSSLGGSRQVPRELARLLNFPYADHVNRIELTEEGLHFEASGNGTIASGIITGPAVLMAGDSAWLRIPTLRNRLAVKNRWAEVLESDGRDAGDKLPEAIKVLPGRGTCVQLHGTVREQAEEILSILREKRTSTVTQAAGNERNTRFTYGGKLCAVFKDEIPELKDISEIHPGWIKNYTSQPDKSEEGLSEAMAVFVAGRGIGSEENRALLSVTAGRLEAKVAATRAAVLNGWYSAGVQVGISGVMLRCETVLVFGASGAAAFTNGIDSCKCVIAVNQDPQAAIFQHADYGCVADCGALLRELENRLSQSK